MPDKQSVSIVLSTIASVLGIVSVSLLGWIAANQIRHDRDILIIQNTRFSRLDFEVEMKDAEKVIDHNTQDIEWLIRIAGLPKPNHEHSVGVVE